MTWLGRIFRLRQRVTATIRNDDSTPIGRCGTPMIRQAEARARSAPEGLSSAEDFKAATFATLLHADLVGGGYEDLQQCIEFPRLWRKVACAPFGQPHVDSMWVGERMLESHDWAGVSAAFNESRQ